MSAFKSGVHPRSNYTPIISEHDSSNYNNLNGNNDYGDYNSVIEEKNNDMKRKNSNISIHSNHSDNRDNRDRDSNNRGGRDGTSISSIISNNQLQSQQWINPFKLGGTIVTNLISSSNKEDKDSLPGGERRVSSGNNLLRRTSVIKVVKQVKRSSKSLLLSLFFGTLLLLSGLGFYYFYNNKSKSTLILTELEIEKIWRWEIASGRYPSFKKTGITFSSLETVLPPPPPIIEVVMGTKDEQIPIVIPPSTEKKQKKVIIDNPLWAGFGNGRERGGAVRAMVEGKVEMQMVGVGQERSYLQVRPRVGYSSWSGVELSSYPKRPTMNSVLDLDAVMDHCDFSEGKYVRDCLEALRLNAGLEMGVRRGDMRIWEMTYITLEDGRRRDYSAVPFTLDMPTVLASNNFKALLDAQLLRTLSQPTLYSAATRVMQPSTPVADQFCNPDYPRIFHIFWVGPFTDKPYTMAMSFLYTQRLNLHLPTTTYVPNLCRPQLWIWINPHSASSSSDITYTEESMKSELSKNPWAAPLLHHRFEDSIKFKLWDTEEQLDSHVEMKGWREMKLFSGKVKFSDKTLNTTQSNPIGSKSQNEYDRLSVDLADMARFLLTHRYGGIYLDADTILLRDWEELWGWKGSFGYRWSRLNTYNTAVLKMQKGSMIGSFIIGMAVRNGGDFHPMHVADYLRDAKLEGLLMRLPDALFDPAWLNVEDYQRDRPAFPFFKSFSDFFNTSSSTAAPNTVSFDGFFRGAFSYHFHNFWWLPFDPSRNYPDLGPRFGNGERIAKAVNLLKVNEQREKMTKKRGKAGGGEGGGGGGGKLLVLEEEEEMDLSWATVVKRSFEAFLRGDRGNLYGEWIAWEQ